MHRCVRTVRGLSGFILYVCQLYSFYRQFNAHLVTALGSEVTESTLRQCSLK